VPLLLLPSVLLQWRRLRENRTLLAVMALTLVVGFIVNRMSVAGLATIAPTGTAYFPSALEFLMSLGLVPGIAVLIWMYLVEHYEVWQPEEQIDGRDTGFSPPRWDNASGVWLGDSPLANFKRYSLAFAFAAAATFALLPRDALFGASAVPFPVQRARGRNVFLIDGDRAGSWVRFDHRKHEEKLGGEESCLQCHHMAVPLDQDTPCWGCHRDMWSDTDIFVHDRHVQLIEEAGTNDPCAACHAEQGAPKSRETVSSCTEEGCHSLGLALYREGARIQPREPDRARYAVGYMDALHGLCIGRHKERTQELGRPHHGDCGTCHQEGREAGVETIARYHRSHELASGGGG